MKYLFRIIWLSLNFIGIQSCSQPSDLDGNGEPKTLIIATPGGSFMGLQKKALEPIRLYLEKGLSRPVKIIFTSDYTSVIEALKAKKIHMAFLPPFAYILATPKVGLIPIVTLGENGKPAMYHSCIITSPKTGIKNLEDLKANSKKLTLCFPDPASTSGHLVAGAFLKSIGLNPETMFKATIFSGSHPATILSVQSGKVDIGCSMTEMGLYKLEQLGMVKKEDFTILWISPPIVSDPIVLRDDINKNFITRVQNLYLNMRRDDPYALVTYLKVVNRDPVKLNFMVAHDSLYNGLRAIARDMHYLGPKN